MYLVFPIGLALLLAIAAVGDARRYIIPNRLTMAVAGWFALYVLVGLTVTRTLTPAALIDPLLVAAAVFAVTAALFALGVMGGGDVKLATATSLWAGSDLVFEFLTLTALAGGVLSMVALVRHKQRMAQSGGGKSVATGPPVDGADADTTAPTAASAPPPRVAYGVAIAVGGIFVASQLIINGSTPS